MAQVGRRPTAPFRGSRETLGRSRRPPGSCTTSISVERSVDRHTRPACISFHFHLPDLLHAAQSTRMSLRVAEPDRHGIRTGSRSERADWRAPARGQPVRTGKPWAVDSGEGALRHVNVRTPGCKDVLRAYAGNHGP